MSAPDLVLNLAVLALVLRRNLGVKPVTWRRFAVSAVMIVVVAAIFLRHIPTLGNDVAFDLVGLAVGLVLGATAGWIPRVSRDSADAPVTHTGAAFAALWVVVIGCRIAFSYCATHVFPHAIATWSRDNSISGSDAFRAMFVLMALGMVAAMTAMIAARARSSVDHAEMPAGPSAIPAIEETRV